MMAAAGEIAAPASDVADAPLRDPQATDFGHSARTQSGLFDRRAAMRSALKAGAIGTFISIIPVLGIVLTGSLSVYFYRRTTGSFPPAATGARLGAAAGVVLFALNAVFIIPIIALHHQQQFLDAVTDSLQKLGMSGLSTQFQAAIGELTPAGLVRFFIAALVLTSLGGALGALIMRRPRS
jgi:hypothetical protein